MAAGPERRRSAHGAGIAAERGRRRWCVGLVASMDADADADADRQTRARAGSKQPHYQTATWPNNAAPTLLTASALSSR
ncbi:hypothetical protein BM1_10797 [Bipolaris maydis]|nr:hypothetical protein BM1_10797 [Bipolaris maydis]